VKSGGEGDIATNTEFSGGKAQGPFGGDMDRIRFDCFETFSNCSRCGQGKSDLRIGWARKG